jgi:ABC-type antimicrobial peptide transport system permease subunit
MKNQGASNRQILLTVAGSLLWLMLGAGAVWTFVFFSTQFRR